MSYDGTLKFDTKIDTTSFNNGVRGLGSVLATGLGLGIKALGAATAGLGALGAASYKAGSSYEAGMSEVEAISGATADEMERLNEVGLDVAKTSKFTASQVAMAYKYMGMAGWDADQMTAALAGTMNLAAASGEELGTVSDIVTDGLTAFGLEAKDAGRFADVLAAAATSSNTNVSMMGDTFKYVAPIIGSLYKEGGRAQEGMEGAAVAIGLMANSGIKASIAGTSLRSILTRLSTDTNGARTALEDLGVEFFDTNGNMRDLNDILAEARVAFAGMTTEEQQNTAQLIAGKNAISGWLALMNAAPGDVDKLTKSIKECDGAAQEMADKMLDNLPGAITKLSSTFDILKVSIYQKMQEPLKNAVLFVKEQLDELQSAFDKGGFQGLVEAIGSVLANVVSKVAEKAPDIIRAATSLISSFGQGLMNALSDLSRSGKINELVVALFEGITTSTEWIFKIGIELIALLGKAVVDNAPKLKASASSMIKNIVLTIHDHAAEIAGGAAQLVLVLAGAISDNMPLIISTAIELVKQFALGLMKNPAALANAAPILITFFASKLISFGASKLMSAGAQWVLQIAQGMLSNTPVISNAVNMIGSMVQGLGSAFTSVGSIAKAAFSTIASAIGPIMTTIGGVTAVIGGIALAFKNLWDMLKEGFSWIKEGLMLLGIAIAAVGAVLLGVPAAVAAVVAGIVAALATLVVVIHDHWEEIKQFFLNIGQGIADFFQGVHDKVSEIASRIGDFFAELPGKIAGFLAQAIEHVVSWAQDLYNKMREAASRAIGAVVEFFSQLPGKIAGFFSEVIGKVVSWGSDLMNRMGEAARNAIDKAASFFSELPGKIGQFLSDVINRVISWGGELVSNITSAVSSAVSGAVQMFSQFVQEVAAKLSEALQHVIQWGKDIAEQALEAGKQFVTSMVSGLKDLASQIGQKLSELITRLKTFVTEMAQKGLEAGKGFLTKIVEGLKGAVEKVTSIGKDIVSGLWNGIKNAWGSLVDNVKGLAGGLVDKIKGVFKINSPSKVFEDDIGEQLPPGIGIGFKNAMPALNNVVDTEMDNFVSRMKSTVEGEMSNISGTVEIKARASSEGTGDTYIDQHVEQTNTYEVPVVTPSVVAEKQREEVRNLLGA